MEVYNKIIKILDGAKVSYEIIDQTSAGSDRSIEALIAATPGATYSDGMATLFFTNEKGEFVVVLRRDDRNLNNGAIKKLSDSKSLSFMDEKTLGTLGLEAGLVTPVMLGEIQKQHKAKVLVDSKVLENTRIICGIAKEGYALRISVNDLRSLIGNHIVGDISVPNPKRVATKTKRIMTGDRPTGKLHIGHLIGSLRNRVALQDEYETFIMIANIHALADHAKDPEFVMKSIRELLKDYYASGLDFDKATVYIQSEVPVIHEIFMYLANFATVQQLMHNPTLKTEIKQNGMEGSTPLGFFVYPIHQAADILVVNADLVPVGKDQAPMVEGSRELARKFNRTYGVDVLNQPAALYGAEINVPGTDGNAKMGKSLGNCIYLADTTEELRKKVFSVYTDPGRIRATDPGKIEGNVAFAYHDAFNPDVAEVEELKNRYKEGKVGDVEVKQRLYEVMEAALAPIRERRLEAESMEQELFDKAIEGSKKVSKIGRGIADAMKDAMKIGI